MDNNEKYEILADGDTGIPSSMGIIPAHLNFKLTKESIEASLAQNKEFKLLSFTKNKDDSSFSSEIEYLDETYSVNFYISVTSTIGLDDFGFANQILKEDFEAALRQPSFLEVSMFFGSEALNSFHLQLKIMNAVVPDASLVVDFMSYRLLSARWLKMTAKSLVPPSPDYLYSLHAVYKENAGRTEYWFHTHGLHRCRSVELEIMNVFDGAQQMNDLITMVVKKFIKDPAKEKEKFQIGYDGLGINLSWLRWEEAVKDFPKDILGGPGDREGDRNVHADPSGILFAVEDNNMVSPEIYAKTLGDNPIFYISNEETTRMSNLAKERFRFFVDIFDKNKYRPKPKSFFSKIFGKKEEEPASWSFLVKFGIVVDDAKAETEKEHLWFRVIDICGNNVKGELLNQPYWISGLKEGDITENTVDLLTDWIIYSPDGNTYTTDSIYQLGYS